MTVPLRPTPGAVGADPCRSVCDDDTPRRGRPRSAEADLAILEAARELLMEHGYEGLSMEAVAHRAGVGKATLYRRWPGKPELVLDVLETMIGEIPLPDTGDTRTDLVQLVTTIANGLVHSPLGRVVRGLSAEFARNRELATAFREGFIAPRRAVARELVLRGVQRGDLRPDIDSDLVLDLLAGPLFYRLLFAGGPITRTLPGEIVEMVWVGVAARP